MVKIVSWNIEGRLAPYKKSGQGSPGQILQAIADLNADIVFLPEAYGTDLRRDPKLDPIVDDMIMNLGYTIIDAEYDEGGAIRDDAAVFEPHLRFLSRLPVESSLIIRLGNLRNAIALEFKDPISHKTVRVIGVHLDDRAEELRQTQLIDLIPFINNSRLPTVMVGDYNAMHGVTRKARMLHSLFFRVIARMTPSKVLRSTFVRTAEMANGSTLSSIESETNLHDVDIRKKPTVTPKARGRAWLPHVPIIDIDHMFVSDDIVVKNFKVERNVQGSDHCPISATVSL